LGVPVALEIHVPEAEGTYAVVVFQHGFLMDNSHYSQLLRHVASHGFVVVAGQMYAADGWPLCKPSTLVEADLAGELLAWLPGRLSRIVGVGADTNALGLAGHSRGGRVAWLVLSADSSRAKAVAGVDPVDSGAGSFNFEPHVTAEPFNFDFPSLVIDAGLGETLLYPWGLSCAPAGANHEQFYAASGSPAWHVVAGEGGHLDILNDGASGCFLDLLCTRGPDPAGMRKLTAGMLTAFFRGSLQGDTKAFDFLSDVSAAPMAIEVEAK
jgi:chlorophyllase